MFREKLKGFIAGVCVTAVLAGAATVFAQMIDATVGNMHFFWDGVEQTLRDANGDVVEPLIYNGTTYVPLRPMANLLGKEVGWDAQTTTVYIGTRDVAATTPIDKFPEDLIDTNFVSVNTGEYAKFHLKDKVITCSNLLLDDVNYNTYILNGQYSRLVGKAVMPYTRVGSDDTGFIAFYSVENDGTENEIMRYDLKQTEDPVDVDVNLRGVENLKISLWGQGDSNVALYDVSFLSSAQ